MVLGLPQLLSSQGFALYTCAGLFIADLIYSKPDDSVPYEPATGTKWFWQVDPAARNIEEPPPNDLMQAELALYQSNQGPWPSWYISWNYKTSDWDWCKGWRRSGLPAQSKRGPANADDRWYWQENPGGQLPTEPPPTQHMVNDRQIRDSTGNTSWPSYYLAAEEVNGNLVWGGTWNPEINNDLTGVAPPNVPGPTGEENARNTLLSFLIVYFLIMMADWIQGPYNYALWKEMHLSEQNIATLYGADVTSSVIAGRFVGLFTDRFGRKQACLMFCVAHFLSCCSMVVPSCWGYVSIPVLVAGRLLRGISTSLLYSAFESWIAQQYDFLKLRSLGYSIGRIFGYLTVIKGVSAYLAGVISPEIVMFTGYKSATMVTSLALLFATWILIATTWQENYGKDRSVNDVWLILSKPKFASLHIVSIIFNVALDLLTLFWVRTLDYKSPEVVVRTLDCKSPEVVLIPYTSIYTTFRLCTIIGSLIFNVFVCSKQVLKPHNTLTAAFLVSAATLAVPYFAGYNVNVSLKALFVLGISPTIRQLLYDNVPNSSHAQLYTIIFLPFFQWVGWGDHFLAFFLGPVPYQNPEDVFMLVAIVMALAALYWHLVSNEIQVFSEDIVNGAPADFKGKLLLVWTLLGALLKKVVTKVGAGLMYVILVWSITYGGLLATMFSAVLHTVPAAFEQLWKWMKGLFQWIFRGGAFPNPPVAVVSPSSLLGADGSADPPPAPRSFRAVWGDFWQATVALCQGSLFWFSFAVIASALIYFLSRMFDTCFDAHLSDIIAIPVTYLWAWIICAALGFGPWVVRLLTDGFFGVKRVTAYVIINLLGFIISCTIWMLRAASWLLKSFWSLWEMVSGVLYGGTYKVYNSVMPKPLADKVSDVLENVSASTGGIAADIIDSSAEAVTSFVERLPIDLQIKIDDLVSEIVSEYSNISTILTKQDGWQDLLQDRPIKTVFAMMFGALLLYLIPWQLALGLLKGIIKGFSALFSMIFSAIYTAGFWLVNQFSTKWQSLWTWVKSGAVSFWDWVTRTCNTSYQKVPPI